MMASASAMTYTPSVSSGGNSADPANSSATHSTSCENELLALDISTNGTTASRTTNKRTYFDRACISFPGDSESPKKRRKQSTPVKIPTSATNPNTEETEPQSEISEGKLEPSISSSPILGNSIPSPDIFSPSSIKQVEEEVAGSQSSPTTSNPLSQNIQSELFKIDFGTPPWMSDMPNKQQEEWLNAPPLHNVPFSFPSLQSPGLTGQVSQFPLMDSNQQSSHLLGRPINQPRIRIFNPDAYCELCNKEFCNKYFLKTHKANKHGIYTDLPGTEMNFTVTTTSTVSTKPITLTTNPEQLPNIPTPPKPPESLTPKITTTLLTAICDICQKKFCNKNFVKRHKAKVHGIVDDTDVDNENSNLDQNISDSNSETNTPKQVSTSPNSNYYSEGLPECLKPFLDTEFDQDNVPYRWPIVGVQSPTALNQQVREAIHRPRGLGIVNPEAFCEICCKEYCNKYFLRTHKLKRHGIAIPDDPPKDPGTSSDGRTIQTSPLNLIKSEQTSSSESYSEKKDVVSDIMMCGICGVHVSQKYMKAHYEACHIIKSNASAENRTTSTSTSSPLSATGGNNEDLNMSETASNDKPIPSAEENINEDLKKLQTMILQLNNLNVCQIVTCNVCCKEFENKFYLQAHMMSDHGQLYMKITDEKISIQNTSTPVQQTSTPIPAGTTENNIKPAGTIPETKSYCSSVDVTPSELQQQRLTPQQVTSLPENVNIQTTVRTTVTPSSVAPSVTTERRLSVSLAPTNSYCEICNKELCNKYFMKTHMQRMHGIEIENGAQIGGVVCNICNKELCSKYFLRVHKHNTHGIVEDGMPLPQSRQVNEETSQPPPSISAPSTSEQPQQFTITDPSLKPNELGDLNHRYFAHFTEVCPICSRRFRSTKWLKAHLVTDHGKAEHDKWEELELLYQKQTSKAQTESQPKSSAESDTSNNPIKIPNGRESDDGQENKLGIQNLLSNIFGQDELNSKKYFCSFCNFSTPVLAFLFVHERSHGQPPLFNKNENIYQCPICIQTYHSAELLQQHIVIQHANITPKQFNQTTKSSILAPTMPTEGNSSSLPNDEKPIITETGEIKIKDDTTNGNETDKSKTPKCLTRKEIPTNIRRFFHGDVVQNLQEMSQQLQLPTTYALPQPQQISKDEQDITHEDRYMMQPFLIEEYVAKEQTTMGVQLRLVPSLVFLPVREKITTPLTTSIKFTPT